MSGSYQAVIDAIRKLQNLDDFVHATGISLPMEAEHLKRVAIRELGELIGYEPMMRIAEQLWFVAHPKIARSVGSYVAELVPCSCGGSGCDWCGGAGRLTKRALEAIQRDEEPE